MEKYKLSIMTEQGKLDTVELPLKQPTGSQVLIKVEACALCTLEQRVYKGMMKKYPFAGGHEVAATVAATGEKVKSLKVGDRVSVRMLTSCGECYYCRTGHENQCVVSFIAHIHEGVAGPGGLSEYMLVESKILYKMSPDIPAEHAALTEPLACCINSVRNGNIDFGNDVVVIGAGIMGAFHVALAKLRGARVIVCEVDKERLEIARAMGADVLVNSAEENATQRVLELTEGRGADAVFCTAALSSLAADAIEMTGKLGATVMYSSFWPDLPIELNVNKVHSKEPFITGAVNQNNRDFLAAAKLLSTKMIDPTPLISEVVPFTELEHAFDRAIDPKTYRVVVKL